MNQKTILLIMAFVFPLYTYKKLHRVKRWLMAVMISTLIFVGMILALKQFEHYTVVYFSMLISQSYVTLDCYFLIRHTYHSRAS